MVVVCSVAIVSTTQLCWYRRANRRKENHGRGNYKCIDNTMIQAIGKSILHDAPIVREGLPTLVGRCLSYRVNEAFKLRT